MTVEIQMAREVAKAAGFGDRLWLAWLDAHNLDLGCSPRAALDAGRLEEVLATIRAFAEGRSPSL